MNDSPSTSRRSGAATVIDVAREAGVAPMTVSYVFSGKRKISKATQQRVFEAAKRLKYAPNLNAQRLVSGLSHNLIGIFTHHLDLGAHSEKVRIVQDALVHRGYEVPIFSGGYTVRSDESLTALLSSLRRQHPRAIICNTMELAPATLDELRRFIDEGGLAVVFDYETDLPCDNVVLDRINSSGDGARYLLQIGHRSIGFWHHNRVNPEDPRFIGYMQAMREFGIEPDPASFFSAGMVFEPEIAGVQLAERFLALPPQQRPTALLIVNDHMALTTIATLQRAGVRVPQDVSVVGHDDRDIARYAAVPLTTAAHPMREIAATIVELLDSRLAGYDGPPRRCVVKGQLIVRESTAPPPGI
jgi:DNA-binding LacI/PurR family transcriptional regulator